MSGKSIKKLNTLIKEGAAVAFIYVYFQGAIPPLEKL